MSVHTYSSFSIYFVCFLISPHFQPEHLEDRNVWIKSDLRNDWPNFKLFKGSVMYCLVWNSDPGYCIVKTSIESLFKHFKFGLLDSCRTSETSAAPYCQDQSPLVFQHVFLIVSVHLSCRFSLAHTHPGEGLLNTMSESVNSTWQCVAPSNTANVTLLLRSQTEGDKVKIMKAHIWCSTSKMTSYLFFFLLLSLLTSLEITLDDGVSVAEAGPQSAHDGRRVWKKG